MQARYAAEMLGPPMAPFTGATLMSPSGNPRGPQGIPGDPRGSQGIPEDPKGPWAPGLPSGPNFHYFYMYFMYSIIIYRKSYLSRHGASGCLPGWARKWVSS